MQQSNWKPSQAAQKFIITPPEENAAYYSEIDWQLDCEGSKHGDCVDDFRTAVSALLGNKLLLDRTGDAPGCGIFKTRFLCCDVGEVELPRGTEGDW